MGRQYAKVTGDFNPIHLGAASAKLFGFKSAIAHGMWTHAWALAQQEDVLPVAYETRVQFTKPVPLPSAVNFVRETAADHSAAGTDAGPARYGVTSDEGNPTWQGISAHLIRVRWAARRSG
ncbi:MaoC family dehydratase [Corynebacterium cystitidis]|uniref:MaoC family dehydratase n=1 Tax=Corynebacterium cystitidis TaxID=35757 RepID=UPI00211DC84B|nr:MaoC/PaaZ C-terminal domain-containing protein [Corynebacterium cystitidis]